VLRRIALLYVIEGEARGLPAERRRHARGERSRVLVDDLHLFLEAKNRQVSAKSKLGEAIRYIRHTGYPGIGAGAQKNAQFESQSDVIVSATNYPPLRERRISGLKPIF